MRLGGLGGECPACFPVAINRPSNFPATLRKISARVGKLELHGFGTRGEKLCCELTQGHVLVWPLPALFFWQRVNAQGGQGFPRWQIKGQGPGVFLWIFRADLERSVFRLSQLYILFGLHSSQL